jgi:very-short-patch-repair endonuclease
MVVVNVGKLIDLTGKKFGRLTVIERAVSERPDTVKWKCACDCGNIKIVSGRDLKSSNTISCGCYKRDVYSKNYCKDETGNIYGNLTVLKRYGINKHGSATWLVKCKCGKEYVLSGSKLRNAHPTKCKECSNKKYWERDDYDISGNKYGFLTPISFIKTGNEKGCWNCRCDCGNTVVVEERNLRYGRVLSCGCMRSKAESKTRRILLKNKIKFVSQKTFNQCKYKIKLRFDFYIPNMNLCIELDGRQHFESHEFFGGEITFKERKLRDKIKNEYCKENNIKLLRVPYTKFDIIEEIFKENNIIS